MGPIARVVLVAVLAGAVLLVLAGAVPPVGADDGPIAPKKKAAEGIDFHGVYLRIRDELERLTPQPLSHAFPPFPEAPTRWAGRYRGGEVSSSA